MTPHNLTRGGQPAMEIYIGLDVHSKRTAYVAQDEHGKILGRGSVETTAVGFGEMVRELGVPEGTRVGLETGGVAAHVAKVLYRLGLEPVVINAAEVRAKARRPNQKSDGRDAFEICDGLRRGIYSSIVHIPPEENQKLREVLSMRRHFVRAKTRETNAVKYQLRAKGLGSVYRSLQTGQAWEKLMGREELSADLKGCVARHYAVWEMARLQVEELEDQFQELSKPFEEAITRLIEVPGVGIITALTVIAIISTASRFPTVKHAASYAGLVPSTYDTGDRERHGHITKRGSGELRAMLVEAAQQARRPTHPLYPYYSALAAKRGPKIAVVAVANRLLRILVAMLKSGSAFDVSKLNVEARMEKVTRTRYWHRRDAARAEARV